MMPPSKTIFVLSILLNMIMAGMLLGHFSRPMVVDTPAPISNGKSELAKLPSDKRGIFEKVMKPAIEELKTHRAEMETAKQEALRILKAEPFDSAAYVAQVQRMSDLHTQMKSRMAASVAELARQMSQTERAILAEIVSRPPFTLPPGMLKQLDSPGPLP